MENYWSTEESWLKKVSYLLSWKSSKCYRSRGISGNTQNSRWSGHCSIQSLSRGGSSWTSTALEGGIETFVDLLAQHGHVTETEKNSTVEGNLKIASHVRDDHQEETPSEDLKLEIQQDCFLSVPFCQLVQ